MSASQLINPLLTTSYWRSPHFYESLLPLFLLNGYQWGMWLGFNLHVVISQSLVVHTLLLKFSWKCWTCTFSSFPLLWPSVRFSVALSSCAATIFSSNDLGHYLDQQPLCLPLLLPLIILTVAHTQLLPAVNASGSEFVPTPSLHSRRFLNSSCANLFHPCRNTGS